MRLAFFGSTGIIFYNHEYFIITMLKIIARKGFILKMADEEKKDEKYAYLQNAMTVDELIEECDVFVNDLNNAAFTATFDIQQGMRLGYTAAKKVFEDLIDRLEEHSPNPEADEFITRLYNVYDALEQLEKKCDYI